MKLIFMGTPEFAVPTLQALIDSTHEVVAVYTQPPRPAGRGYDIQKSPIHRLAETHDIPVHIPKTLRNTEVQIEFTTLNADAAVVAAYGLILPKEILDACPHGCINIHPSLLPRWRGCSPIQRTIMAGDSETGMCIMQMDEGLDSGAVLMCEIVPLSSTITAGELHDQLAELGARMLLDTLDHLDTLTPQPQSEEGVTYADKLTKECGYIDWSLDAKALDCLIRGVTPWPGACFMYQNERIKILATEWTDKQIDATPGTVIDEQLTIACNPGTLRPTIIQRPGKKAMYTDDFLRGHPVKTGTILI